MDEILTSTEYLKTIHKTLRKAKHQYIIENEPELELNGGDGKLMDCVYPIDNNDSTVNFELKNTDKKTTTKPLTIQFDKQNNNSYNDLNWGEWVSRKTKISESSDEEDVDKLIPQFSLEDDEDEDDDDSIPELLIENEEEELILNEKKLKTIVDDSIPSPPKKVRKEFWDRNHIQNYSIGYNGTKMIKSHIPLEQRPIGARGKPLTNGLDKVQCQVCGSIYSRNSGSNHRKSLKHIKAFNVAQHLLETLLTARKRKYKLDV